MKLTRLSQTILFALFCIVFAQGARAATWYVRADGGTRYSANNSQGQCDGLADAAYPGKGVNQHCAFNDYRFLYDDQHTYGKLQWVIAGGDTVILDNTKQWRVGFDTDGAQGSDAWCWGDSGPYGCYNPTIPAGTAANPTRILGRNYASCNVGNAPDKTKMTQIFGGHGVWDTLNLGGAQNVQLACIEVTRHSQCIVHGSPNPAANCNQPAADGGVQDYDSSGIGTDQGTQNILLQDMWIHGHTDRGIKGPIGGLVTANRVDISTNGMAGWDFDDGNSTPSVNATLKMSYSTVEWNGCNQEYPAVHAIPVLACYSQSTGGYGDGIGTPTGMGINVYMDHDVFRYNTQDGEDFGHIDTGSNVLSVTDSASYGNNGGQFKWGPAFTTVTFANNVAVGNCLRLSAPMNGTPSGYNANLADFCRAMDAISFNFYDGGTAVFANNTIVSYSPTTFDFQCWTAAGCPKAVFTFENNIVRAYDNPGTWAIGGQQGGPGSFCGASCNGSTPLVGTINRSNNIYYGFRGSCVANQTVYAMKGTAKNESCSDAYFTGEPATFTTEASWDTYNLALSAQSPALYAGVADGITTDFDSNAFHVPPSEGALENKSALLVSTIGSTWPYTPVSSPISPVVPPTPVAPTQPTQPTAPTTQSPVATSSTLAGQAYSTLWAQVTVTATVKAATGTAVPTGTVTLTSNGSAIGTATLNAQGQAAWTILGFVQDTGIAVVYAGNSSFTGSTSPKVTIAPH